jgi:protein subunit release factor A
MTDQATANTATVQANQTANSTDTASSQGLSTADLVNRGNQNSGTQVESRATSGGANAPLFAGDEAETFRSRWTDIQTGFVDEPRKAVEDADGLVAEVIQKLAQMFADERSTLESQWGQGDDVSTEDLRIAMQRYRSFFDRLLSV